MNRAFKSLGFAMLVAATAMAAHAQAPSNGPIETRMEARKVQRTSDGKEMLVPAQVAKPGDVIEYAVTYRNAGQAAVSNLEATLPIPAHTELIRGSTRPASAKASLDANAFGEMPLQRRTTRAGLDALEPIPEREYRYLRWYPGELAPGKSVTFVARVKVVE
jgi:uncharacterized repeat protein (TIGR01451 family)